jgi:hypothetical protein
LIGYSPIGGKRTSSFKVLDEDFHFLPYEQLIEKEGRKEEK